MITFEQIQKVNEDMTGIDFKGKNYVMVNSRVTAFRKLFPEGFIITNMISNDNGICIMQAKAGYYEDGEQIILGTGLAFEERDRNYINKTSYIENCETSAVGRALGFLALGNDDSICSAEELVNAITNQNNDKQASKSDNKQEAKVNKAEVPVKVEESARIPSKNPVMDYINNELSFMAKLLGIDSRDEMLKKFSAMKNELVESGVIPNVKSDKQTMEQAKQMITAIYRDYIPEGYANGRSA